MNLFKKIAEFLAKLAQSVQLSGMAQEQNNEITYYFKKNKLKQLFGLCEAWLAGGVRDDQFSVECLKLRKELLEKSWDKTSDPTERKLFEQFNMAVQCVIAVEQTMQDLKKLARSKNPPLATRAFYFGRRISSEAIFQLETVLRID